VHPSEFTPLDQFELAWRWTQPTHAVLPAEALATIRPFTSGRAADLDAQAGRLSRQRPLAQWALSICADDDAAESVREHLRALSIANNTEILVSWSRRAAVLTVWQTFVEYWDDFCYPSSDDVTVWPPSGEWVLCYRHYQHIDFGRPAVA
jgi:hypothetical protein